MPSIQDEIKQTRPFPSRSAEAVVALMRTADMVRRSVASVVEPAGITPQQYNVLRILRGAGEAGLPTLEIAERMIEETPGITRLLDRLESKVLVTRVRCDKDRRRVWCRITPQGLDLLRQLDAPLQKADEAALQTLGNHDLEQLIELLDKARNVYRRIS
ncbi:MAG TPA: MarR family transcriptional regulator [Thermoanaerobaculia bacterium]|nr:MarR family transcriptional regulator [Thermoanaerobaculia bacterium]